MNRVRCTFVAAFLAAGAFGSPRATHAEPRAPERDQTPEFAAELTYTRGIGAERCPDAAELRRAVAARLGQDPFAAARGQRFRVEISAASERFVGHIALVDDAGTPAGSREFEGSRDCGELVTAMALAVSLAINPNLVVSEEPAVPAPAPEPEQHAAARPIVAPLPAAPSSAGLADGAEDEPSRVKTQPASGVGLSAGVFALGAVGIGPSANFGASLAVRLRALDAFSLTLEGRADTPATGNLATGGSVKTQLYAGVLAPCWHVRFAAGCAVALVGRYHAESRGLNAAGSDAALYAAFGGRLAFEYPFSARFALQIRGELLGTLWPPTLLRNSYEPVWSAPPVSGGIGLGVLGEIL